MGRDLSWPIAAVKAQERVLAGVAAASVQPVRPVGSFDQAELPQPSQYVMNRRGPETGRLDERLR